MHIYIYMHIIITMFNRGHALEREKGGTRKGLEGENNVIILKS